ncbi:hypothetical protein [Aequorivita sp. CIP111184]|uniref:hypothetical protein n=1 Tax=Aequorivita sp. CIP111184 TaxID=2211356 RepID=UPI000DBBFF1A|nr:hypothetical protein [Aequorivita sp. CIP111184]SRX54505.1 hypothetical protein AEQU1_01516 [Aequorivita sp. CIP111184]
MKNLIWLGLTILLMSSCNNKEKSETVPVNTEVTQMQRIVAVHDALMPKMSTIGELSGKIQASIDVENPDDEKVSVLNDLKAANADMMEWMKDFGKNFTFEEINKGAPLSEEKQELLKSYEKSVNQLQEQMNTAIENGNKLIE